MELRQMRQSEAGTGAKGHLKEPYGTPFGGLRGGLKLGFGTVEEAHFIRGPSGSIPGRASCFGSIVGMS